MGLSLYLVFNNKLLRPTQRLRIVFLTIVFLVYLFGGAYIFQQLNLPVELQIKQEIFEYKKSFLESHKCIDPKELNDFIQEIEYATGSGIIFVENKSQELTPNWSFGGETFFFVMTTLTTIGYGQIHPLTQNGRFFTIFYITLGVPLSMLLLTLLTSRLEYEMTKGATRNRLVNYLNQKSYRVDSNNRSESPPKSGKLVLKQRFIYLQTFKVGLLLFIFIYLIPSCILTFYMESSWSILDSLYYCYISVTTIGFGDLVPGEDFVGDDRGRYRLFVTFYLMIGVVMNMLFLNMLFRLPWISKIHSSWLKLKRRRLFKFGPDNEEEIENIEENEKDSDDKESYVKKHKNSNLSNRTSPIYMDKANDVNEIDVIENLNRSTSSRGSKTKDI